MLIDFYPQIAGMVFTMKKVVEKVSERSSRFGGVCIGILWPDCTEISNFVFTCLSRVLHVIDTGLDIKKLKLKKN